MAVYGAQHLRHALTTSAETLRPWFHDHFARRHDTAGEAKSKIRPGAIRDIAGTVTHFALDAGVICGSSYLSAHPVPAFITSSVLAATVSIITLFSKFEPAERKNPTPIPEEFKYLGEYVREFSRKAALPYTPNLKIHNDQARADRPITSDGELRAIWAYEPSLRLFNREQLRDAVVHEIFHLKKKHYEIGAASKALRYSAMAGAATNFIYCFAQPKLSGFAAAAAIALGTVAANILITYSEKRVFECQVDRANVLLTRKPNTIIAGLRRIRELKIERHSPFASDTGLTSAMRAFQRFQDRLYYWRRPTKIRKFALANGIDV